MRKKYLSALLFGALLLASAGTFTSCKDYDDDIKNLQEQINTVKTSLDELTTKVNNLGAGITDFKYENGQLVIVTDKGTNFTVDMPECEGIVKLEIKDGVLYADGVAVGNVSGDGGSVVEVKDGVIYIDGKAAGELGNKVAVTDNGNGTYTLTVDGKEYVLPKASASVSVILSNEVCNSYFTNTSYDYVAAWNAESSAGDKEDASAAGGIVWGKASNYDGKWAGLKSVTKDGLLVGKVNMIGVEVLPANFDLTTAKLTLVNTLGETAPVKVTPLATGSNVANTGSRAASANGAWVLQIAMDETISLDNIGTAFATEVAYNVFKNVNYALAVDGKVVTPYDIVVDTQEDAEDVSFVYDNINGKGINTVENPYYKEYIALNYVKADGTLGRIDVTKAAHGVNNQAELPLGNVTISLSAKNETSVVKQLDKIYDSYIEIVNKDLSDSKEITASGMTITSTDKAANKTDVQIRVHVLDVTGKEVVSPIYTVKFGTKVVAGETIKDQTVTVMPASAPYIIVDLGDTFTGLTADQAEDISSTSTTSSNVSWTVSNGAKTFKAGVLGNGKITYFATAEDAAKGEKAITLRGETSTIRTIKYARIDALAFKQYVAEAGDNTITITMKDDKANEIKKVSATVTVALPKFDDVIAANTEYTLWDGNTLTTRMSRGTYAQISLDNAFISKKDANNKYYYNDGNLSVGNDITYEVTYVDPATSSEVTLSSVANLTDLIDTENFKLKVNELNVTATAYICGNTQTKLVATKDFTVKLKSIFEGAEVVYYAEKGKTADVVDLPGTGIIANGTQAKVGEELGLFIKFEKNLVPYTVNARTVVGALNVNTDYVRKNTTPGSADFINVAYSQAVGSAGDLPATEGSDLNIKPVEKSGIQIGNIEVGESGTLIIEFIDANGIKTTSELKYAKNK